MKQKPIATLRMIAAEAGVAHSTVSMALRNHPSIPAATCRRIQAVAKKLGYRPHPLFSTAFAQMRSRKPITTRETLAFVTAFPTRDGWREASPIYCEYFEGAQERANQLGYQLEEVWAKERGMTGRRFSEVLLARGIQGLLVAPVPAARGHLSLDWSRFAAATMGYSVWRPDLHRVVINHYQITNMVLRELARHGYGRVGLVLSVSGNERTHHIHVAGLLANQQRLPAGNRIPPLMLRDWNEAVITKWFLRFKPDAVITISKDTVPDALRRCGYRIPQDVGFATLHRIDSDDMNSGAVVPARVVGMVAVDLVVGQLYRNELGLPKYPQLVQIPGQWVEGTTLRRR